MASRRIEKSNRDASAMRLNEEEPPEIQQTHKRLVASGFSDTEAALLIREVLAHEMAVVVKGQRPWDLQTVLANLAQLPVLPEGIER